MSYGIPYVGSKNIYAKYVCCALPHGNRLVDLFAGGCAITDCALKLYPYKWNSYLINDVDIRPITLYKDCFDGKYTPSYKWLSREDFEKTEDWTTRLIWSFGSKLKTYIYGKDIEPYKHDIHEWVTNNKRTSYSNILEGIELPELNSIEERYSYWLSIKGQLEKAFSKNLQLQHFPSLYRLNSIERELRLAKLSKLEIETVAKLKSIKNDKAKGCNQNNFKQLSLFNTEEESVNKVKLDLTNNSYLDYEYQDGDVVYCDIPYYQTSCSQYERSSFNHEEFWDWARSRPFDVYVSERIVPDDAKIVFEHKVQNRLSNLNNGFKTEYLVKL